MKLRKYCWRIGKRITLDGGICTRKCDGRFQTGCVQTMKEVMKRSEIS